MSTRRDHFPHGEGWGILVTMDADQSRPQLRSSSRPVARAHVDEGPPQVLRDALYLWYGRAGSPRLDDLAEVIKEDDTLPGAPGKDVITRAISGEQLASRQDTVSIAVSLIRAAGSADTADLARQIGQLWDQAWTAPPLPARLGQPIAECDPLTLEVHPAIALSPGADVGQILPEYVRRAHDSRLRELADQVLAGSSRLVTVVGGSSTGKTRACWEIARYLEQQQPGRWWLWHPYDPTRPEAAAAAINQAGPHTIVWLNEAQFYLAPPDIGLGERIAAGLRSLLDSPKRGPVLVLATLWPEYWNRLAVRPAADQPDHYSQARYLLNGTRTGVADEFTKEELTGLQNLGVDPRVRQAATLAEGGRITQYLAGAPELEDRYRTAPAPARAIIEVAMDARRLGHPTGLSHTLLERAAPGYLSDHDWDIAGEDWLEQAFAYTAQPCMGARGPLTRIRTRPGETATDIGGRSYRLADYLEQTGRTERAGTYPPECLWKAFAETVTDPVLLRNLGLQAEKRGRYQHAIWLYGRAADYGDTGSLLDLATMRERAGDGPGAEALAGRAADNGDTGGLRSLATMREQTGNSSGAEVMAERAAGYGDTAALRELAAMRERAGHVTEAQALAVRAANYGDTGALRGLAWRQEEAGNAMGAKALYRQAADRGDTGGLRGLARRRERAGDGAGAEELYREAAELGNVPALWDLARMRKGEDSFIGSEVPHQRGTAPDSSGRLARAKQPDPDRRNASTLRNLAVERERAGDVVGAEALYRQAIEHGDTGALGELAALREQAGDSAGADRIRRFGLTGSGGVATGLDFSSTETADHASRRTQTLDPYSVGP